MIEYKWFDDLCAAKVTIHQYNQEFTGYAVCHPDDIDMCSERTGYLIAEMRAQIKVLQYARDCDILPRLRALQQAYYSMNRSKYFNPKSYENSILQSQIRLIKEELNITRSSLQFLRKKLKDTIIEKDNFYQAIRKHREEQNNG